MHRLQSGRFWEVQSLRRRWDKFSIYMLQMRWNWLLQNVRRRWQKGLYQLRPRRLWQVLVLRRGWLRCMLRLRGNGHHGERHDRLDGNGYWQYNRFSWSDSAHSWIYLEVPLNVAPRPWLICLQVCLFTARVHTFRAQANRGLPPPP